MTLAGLSAAVSSACRSQSSPHNHHPQPEENISQRTSAENPEAPLAERQPKPTSLRNRTATPSTSRRRLPDLSQPCQGGTGVRTLAVRSASIHDLVRAVLPAIFAELAATTCLIPKNQLEQACTFAGRISGRSPACRPNVQDLRRFAKDLRSPWPRPSPASPPPPPGPPPRRLSAAPPPAPPSPAPRPSTPYPPSISLGCRRNRNQEKNQRREILVLRLPSHVQQRHISANHPLGPFERR